MVFSRKDEEEGTSEDDTLFKSPPRDAIFFLDRHKGLICVTLLRSKGENDTKNV